MSAKINLLTALCALALFFLPWVDFQSSGSKLATQTGIQAISGSGTFPRKTGIDIVWGSGTFNLDTGLKNFDETGGPRAPLLGVALLAILAAIILSFFRLRKSISLPLVEVLCALALILIGFQIFTGLPLKKELEVHTLQSAVEHTRYDPSAGYDPGLASAAALMKLEIRHLPGLWLELAVLTIPTLLLVARGFAALRKRTIPKA